MFCCEEKDCCNESESQPTQDRDATWIDVTKLFPDPQECLASYLAVWAAEVLSAVKPANLIRINNRKLACGRNMYQLWLNYGEKFIDRSPLKAKPLIADSSGVLLLLYRPELLQKRIDSLTMQAFLARCGYPRPLSMATALRHLEQSYQAGVPDEIGMFLGYPLKDVKGFMTKSRKPWTGRCLWRIYGRAERSLRLNRLYQQAKQKVIADLAADADPLDILQVA